MLRHQSEKSLEKQLNSVVTLKNMLRHSSKMSAKKECHDNPEYQSITHSVMTHILVSRHSFQRSTSVHHESNVMTNFEDTRFEGNVVTIKIVLRQSQLNLKGQGISTMSRQRHNRPWRHKIGREGHDTQHSQFNFKGKIISTMSRQHHDNAPRHI